MQKKYIENKEQSYILRIDAAENKYYKYNFLPIIFQGTIIKSEIKNNNLLRCQLAIIFIIGLKI